MRPAADQPDAPGSGKFRSPPPKDFFNSIGT
jgi:hypothetical protein